MPERRDLELLAIGRDLADAAGRAILPHFRSADLAIDSKLAESFDPVTVADRAAEAAMRAILGVARPDDGIVGEEMGAVAGTSGLTWVLDPIDGTRGFLAGTPTWGVLIAVMRGGQPILGIVDQPWTGERFIGCGGRAWLERAGAEAPLRCRAARPLAQAILMTTFPEVGTLAEAAAFRRVAEEVRLVRYGTDCYAYALVAAGQIDLVIEAGLKPWDIAAPLALVEAAGGIVTDWRGDPAVQGGQVIAAANAHVHRAALDLLAGGAAPRTG